MLGPSFVSIYRPLVSQMWRLAFPVILANLLMTAVNIVDVFMAGRLGPVEIAAIGMANAVRLLVMIAILAVTSGSMALAAQARGARDPDAISVVARQSLSLTVVMSALISVVGYVLSEPLLAFLNSDGDPRAVELGSAYLQLLFIGTLFLTINFTVNSLMQGAGDTVTPLYISGVINVLNIGFNYVFMFGLGPVPAYGVQGAAMGTILARAIASVLGIAILYSQRNVVKITAGSYRPDLGMFRDILSIGVPTGLQGIVRNTAQILVLRIITMTPAGTYGAAALAIGIQVESLAFMPGLAISVAATSLVGQALGAWQVEDARRRGNVAIVMGIVVMSVIALPIILFAPQVVRFFDPSAHPTVVAAGASYLVINMLSQPLLAVAMVVNGTLRGAGDTRPGLVGTFLGRWLVVVPLAYGLALVAGWGVEGVWWALFAGTAVQAAYVWRRWQSGAWLDVALQKTMLYRRHLRHVAPLVQRRYLVEVRAPLMARDGIREFVDEDGVVYRNGEREEARVAFHGDHYDVVRTDALAPPHEVEGRARSRNELN